VLLWVAGGLALSAVALLIALRKKLALRLGPYVRAGQDSLFKAALPSAGQQFAALLLQVAREKNLDPFILAAIAEQESGFNPNVIGYDGHGRGLFQIDDRYHNLPNWQDPLTNARKGADILLDNLAWFRAKPSTPTVTLTADEAAARGVSPGVYRDPRPLTGDLLIRATIAGYNASRVGVLKSVAVRVSPDALTTGKNYSANILARLSATARRFAA
jgi:soluble lytic murein transglycosylase-like protein